MAYQHNYYHILGFEPNEAGHYQYIARQEIIDRFVLLVNELGLKNLPQTKWKKKLDRLNNARSFLLDGATRRKLDRACEHAPDTVIAKGLRLSTIITTRRIARGPYTPALSQEHKDLLRRDLSQNKAIEASVTELSIEEFFLIFKLFEPHEPYHQQMAAAILKLEPEEKNELTSFLVDCIAPGSNRLPCRPLIKGLCEYLLNLAEEAPLKPILKKYLINLIRISRSWDYQTIIPNESFIADFSKAQCLAFINHLGIRIVDDAEVHDATDVDTVASDVVDEVDAMPDYLFAWLRDGTLSLKDYLFENGSYLARIYFSQNQGVVHLIKQGAVDAGAMARCNDMDFFNDMAIATLIDDIPFNPYDLMLQIRPIDSSWSQPQRAFIAHMLIHKSINNQQFHDITHHLLNFVFEFHAQKSPFLRKLLIEGLGHMNPMNRFFAYMLEVFYQLPPESRAQLLTLIADGLRQRRLSLSQYLVPKYLAEDPSTPLCAALELFFRRAMSGHNYVVYLITGALDARQSCLLITRLGIAPELIAEYVVENIKNNKMLIAQLQQLAPEQKAKLAHAKGIVSLLKRDVIRVTDLPMLSHQLLELLDDEEIAQRLHRSCKIIAQYRGQETFLTYFAQLANYPWEAKHRVMIAHLCVENSWLKKYFKVLTPFFFDVMFRCGQNQDVLRQFLYSYETHAIVNTYAINAGNTAYQALSPKEKAQVCSLMADAFIEQDLGGTMARMLANATMPLLPPMQAFQRFIQDMVRQNIENSFFIGKLTPTEISAFFYRCGIHMPPEAPSHVVSMLNQNQLSILFFIECPPAIQQWIIEDKEIFRIIHLLRRCSPDELENLSTMHLEMLKQKAVVDDLISSVRSIPQFIQRMAGIPERLDLATTVQYYCHRVNLEILYRTFAMDAGVSAALDQVYASAKEPIARIDSIMNSCKMQELKRQVDLDDAFKRSNAFDNRDIDLAARFVTTAFMAALAATLRSAKTPLTEEEVLSCMELHFANAVAQLHASTETNKLKILNILVAKPGIIDLLSKVFAQSSKREIDPLLASPLLWLGYREHNKVRENYIFEKLLTVVKAAKSEYDTPKPATTPAESASGFSAMCSTSTAVQIATHGPSGQRRSEELVTVVTALSTARERLAHLRNFLDNYSFITGPWKDGSFKPCLVKALVNHFGSGALRQAFAKIVFSPSTDEAKPQAMSIFLQLEQEILHTIDRSHQAVAATTTVSSTQQRPAG